MVSVCITTFNHAPYIGRAIESVQRQRVTFPIEIIIGDDCSQDATLSIVERYAAEDSRIRVLRAERNEGMHLNYRRTLLAARGRWVALCDGDDFWSDDEKLARQIAALDASPEAGIPSPQSLAFLIGRAISRHGTKGSHDLEKVKDGVIPWYKEKIAIALGHDMENYIRKIVVEK